MDKNQKAQTEPRFTTAPITQMEEKSRRMGLTPLMVEADLPNPIVVRVAHYKGKARASIRFHYRDGGGLTLSPTKRGIEIPIEVAEEVHTLLGEIIRQAKRAGLT